MSTTKAPIQLPLRTVVNGREWRLYGVDYDTADGKFSTYIYALSFEHAAAVVQELRESASLAGELDSWAKA